MSTAHEVAQGRRWSGMSTDHLLDLAGEEFDGVQHTTNFHNGAKVNAMIYLTAALVQAVREVGYEMAREIAAHR